MKRLGKYTFTDATRTLLAAAPLPPMAPDATADPLSSIAATPDSGPVVVRSVHAPISATVVSSASARLMSSSQ